MSISSKNSFTLILVILVELVLKVCWICLRNKPPIDRWSLEKGRFIEISWNNYPNKPYKKAKHYPKFKVVK